MEIALALPLVALLFLALVQVGLVVRDQVVLTHAAREAAREAAVDDSGAVARAAALKSGALVSSRLRVDAAGQRRGSVRVEVRLRYRAPTDVVLVGPLVPDVVLHSRAAMRRESGSKD